MQINWKQLVRASNPIATSTWCCLFVAYTWEEYNYEYREKSVCASVSDAASNFHLIRKLCATWVKRSRSPVSRIIELSGKINTYLTRSVLGENVPPRIFRACITREGIFFAVFRIRVLSRQSARKSRKIFRKIAWFASTFPLQEGPSWSLEQEREKERGRGKTESHGESSDCSKNAKILSLASEISSV